MTPCFFLLPLEVSVYFLNFNYDIFWCVSLGSCGRRVKKKKSSPPVLLSQVVLVVKNPPASVGDIGDEGSIPG